MSTFEAAFGEELVFERLGLCLASKFYGGFVGAVDDEDLSALGNEAEDGGPGRATRAEDDDARALQFQPLFQRPDHSSHIRIESIYIAVGAGAQGVAGADAGRQRIGIR